MPEEVDSERVISDKKSEDSDWNQNKQNTMKKETFSKLFNIYFSFIFKDRVFVLLNTPFIYFIQSLNKHEVWFFIFSIINKIGQ